MKKTIIPALFVLFLLPFSFALTTVAVWDFEGSDGWSDYEYQFDAENGYIGADSSNSFFSPNLVLNDSDGVYSLEYHFKFSQVNNDKLYTSSRGSVGTGTYYLLENNSGLINWSMNVSAGSTAPFVNGMKANQNLTFTVTVNQSAGTSNSTVKNTTGTVGSTTNTTFSIGGNYTRFEFSGSGKVTLYKVVFYCVTDGCSAFTNATTTTTTSVIDDDLLEGLPDTGSNLGSFLTNLAPGIGVFMLILAIFGGVVLLIYTVVSVAKGSMKK